MINLALLGYGKMGKTLAQLAPQRGFEVRLVMDIDVNAQSRGITREKFKGVDVCVDFTTPDAVVENVHRVAALGVNLVVGTTGWQKHQAEIRKVVEQAGVGMVYAANFSIGVNLFYRLARAAAEIFAPFPMYDPFVIESHHKMKKDAPSGTALALKQALLEVDSSLKVEIVSLREGEAVGTHTITARLGDDVIQIHHEALSRRSFAEGAIRAAEWLCGKTGCYDFKQIYPQLQ